MQLWAAPQEALGLLVWDWQEHRIIYLWIENMGVTAREQMQEEAEKCGLHYCFARRRSVHTFKTQVEEDRCSSAPFTVSWIMSHWIHYGIFTKLGM